MTNDEAMKYTRYAAGKALAELETQYAVHMALNGEIPSVYQSKIGGIPYFPVGAGIPVDSSGDQLRFLMQINCSDVRGIGCFPKQGMIQFWICADDCWGMCDRNDRGYRVIYYDTISENLVSPPISAYSDTEKEFYPIKGEFGITFLPVTENTPKKSMKYEKAFCKFFSEISGASIKRIYDLRSALALPYEVYEEALYNGDSSSGHKIGGFSDFCQFDPRETAEQMERYDFQLLQLCSDFGRMNGEDITNIMWGDAGICHFFINSEKLKSCDFSDILYYTDCC